MDDPFALSPDRRRALLGTVGLGIAAALGTTTARAEAAADTARLPPTPATTEGPFYKDVVLARSDIAEGRRGVPIAWRLAVVGLDRRPANGLRVDLWHCDASGYYSGFEGQGPRREVSTIGRTFLRGTQVAGRDGVVEFRSVYPGWYEGRTAHVHLKVFDGPTAVLTSQLFLPDALSEFLYTNVAAYRRLDPRDTLNRDDDIAAGAGDPNHAAVREQAGRYVAEATIVVDPNAKPVVERPLRPLGDDRPARSRDDGTHGTVGMSGGSGGGTRGGANLGFGGGGGRRGPSPSRDEARGPAPSPETSREHAILAGEARIAALVPGEPR